MEGWVGSAKTIVVGVDGEGARGDGDGGRRQGRGVPYRGDDPLVGMAEIDAEQEQVIGWAGWGIEQIAIEAKRDREHHGYGVSRAGGAGELLQQFLDREAVEVSAGQELVALVRKDAGIGIEHQEDAGQGEQWPVAASTKRQERGINEVDQGVMETVSSEGRQGVVHVVMVHAFGGRRRWMRATLVGIKARFGGRRDGGQREQRRGWLL